MYTKALACMQHKSMPDYISHRYTSTTALIGVAYTCTNSTQPIQNCCCCGPRALRLYDVFLGKLELVLVALRCAGGATVRRWCTLAIATRS